MIQKTTILDIAFSNDTTENILEYLFDLLENAQKKIVIVTPNPEMLVYAQKHPSFKKLLNDAQISLCDGVGVHVASKLLGSPIKERIAGVDFMEMVCKKSVNGSKNDVRKPIVIGFLGGKRNVAKQVAECLRKKYPGLVVGFAGSEWPSINVRGPASLHPHPTSSLTSFVAGARRGSPALVTPHLHVSQIDILFVAYGFPKQEEWIAKNLSHIPVKAAMGVGGAFDYISGEVGRAPFPIRAIGLEWLFRLLRQPWRIKRQTSLIVFAALILKELARMGK